jgi:hypothetical protein
MRFSKLKNNYGPDGELTLKGRRRFTGFFTAQAVKHVTTRPGPRAR